MSRWNTNPSSNPEEEAHQTRTRNFNYQKPNDLNSILNPYPRLTPYIGVRLVGVAHFGTLA